jgi:hypothetical protein
MTAASSAKFRFVRTDYETELEARWAVFFSHLGLESEYRRVSVEPDPEEMMGAAYRPSFYVKGLLEPILFDVHKLDEKNVDLDLAQKASSIIGIRSFVAYGLPTAAQTEPIEQPRSDGMLQIAGPSWDNLYAFCVCRRCGRVGIEFEGRAGRVCGDPDHGQGRDDDFNTYSDPRIVSAYEAANSIRFS